MSGELIRRATIDEMDGHRRVALQLYGEAFDALSRAGSAAAAACPRHLYNMPELHSGNRSRGHCSGFKTREEFMADATQNLDRAIWTHLLDSTGLDRLMDRTAKEQFRAQLETDPPEANAENAFATLAQLVEDRDMIFMRGLAKAFAGLDRRFRSHDGFKLGERLVFRWFADQNGYINRSGRTTDSILDVERVFYVLDGKGEPETRDAGVMGALALAKEAGGGTFFKPAQYEATSDYFRAKVFKNGNAHVWFTRDDLVERVNQLLAEYYGAALGASPDVADVRHAPDPNMPAPKGFAFFETPHELAMRVCSAAGVFSADEVRPGLELTSYTVLEPSAGRGAIASVAAARGAHVTCLELQGAHCQHLLEQRRFVRVLCGDFLTLSPDTIGRFERVLMNPPFDRGRDVDHVSHALDFLAPGGMLVAIMSAGVEFRQDAKTEAFRKRVEAMRGRFEDLPEGSFKEAGTMVNTVLLTVRA